MASEAQVVANRLNAQKSTGPRTPAGKAVASQNAVKHGLSARQDVIIGEDPGEFEFHRDRMLGELTPVGAVESMLAERVVGLAWRLRRVERLQNQTFDALLTPSPLAKLTQSMLAKRLPATASEPEAGALALGRMAVKDFSNGRVLDRLLMYERRIEHSLFKTMAELQRLRLSRELDGPAEEPAGGVPVRNVARASRSGKDKQGQDGLATKVPRHSDIPSFQPSMTRSGRPAGKNLSCKTNPICPRPNEGQVPSDKGVTQNSVTNHPQKTDPISMGKGHTAYS